MKFTSVLLLLTTIIAPPLFAGDGGNIRLPTTYLTIGGGYFNGYFNEDFIRHTQAGLVENSFFNNKYDSYYGQIGLGSDFQLGSLPIGQQFVIGKLASKETFPTSSALWFYRQDFDIGYDLMPKMRLANQLEAFAIAGVHYGQFNYRKDIFRPTTAFNVDGQQLGFNLGIGARYRFNDKFALDLRYQHVQYASQDIYATFVSGTALTIDHIKVKPIYNLVGLQLNYYFA